MNTNNNHIFKIPDDLLLFLKNETYSLLIKGEPGIGKTALCMAILRELNIKNNFFYISTRVSPNKLFYYFRWLNKYLKMKHSNSHNKSSKNENLFEPYFEDARLDEPESLFERITNQLMDVRAPLIIVDSWDGIASFMDRESRLNNERVLQTWLERAGGRLILVGEGTGISTLDYLVDGVVTLRNTNYQCHDLRKIYLNKLRGINITNKSFLFTLHDGIFRTIESYKNYLSFDPILNSSVPPLNKFGSGYDTLDKDLNGGITDNSILLIEYDFQIGIKGVIIFLLNFINESFKNSYTVFMDSSLINSYDSIIKELKKESINDFIQTIDFFKKSKINTCYENNLDDIKLSYSLSEELNKLESHSSEFGIIDLDKYEKINLEKVSNLLTNRFNISFLIKKVEMSSQQYSNLSDYHLQLLSINGIFFISFKYPLSNIYTLEIKKNKIDGNLIYTTDVNPII